MYYSNVVYRGIFKSVISLDSKVLQKYQTLRFGSIIDFLSLTFPKNTERRWKIFKKWISLVYCVYKKSKACRVLNEWFYFCLKENDMILSRFMWLELLSKSNILRPIPLYMMKRKNSLEFLLLWPCYVKEYVQ